MSTTNTTRRISPIDIIYGTVWPWCFSGKRSFELDLPEAAEGKDMADNFQFDVQWRPYQLNAILPKGQGLENMWSVWWGNFPLQYFGHEADWSVWEDRLQLQRIHWQHPWHPPPHIDGQGGGRVGPTGQGRGIRFQDVLRLDGATHPFYMGFYQCICQ